MSQPVENSSPFSSLIEHAIELASQWHDGTYRKSAWREPVFTTQEGENPSVPVISHVTTVAMMVQRAGWDEETIAAAFLHDVLEDPNQHKRYAKYEALREVIGTAVADRVLEVTEQKYDEKGKSRTWRQRKDDYITGLRTHSPEAVAISLADKTHNLWTMNQSLARRIDIFSPGTGRKPLTAGPKEQVWFHRSVLDLSQSFDDPRLEPLRRALQLEIDHFENLLSQS